MSRIRRITPVKTGWLLLSLLLTAGFVTGAQAQSANHLIISEVVAQSRFDSRLGGQNGSEFIEITNPTASTIQLQDVYLSDATYTPSSVFYWNITSGTPTSASIGGGAFNDFHVRFPNGASLGAGEVLVISLAGSDEYFAAYDQLPDYELFEDSDTPDVVPEMVAVFPGSVHAGEPLGELNTDLFPELGDTAESLILYQWDGQSDIVADLDYMYWGAASASANSQIDKSSVSGYNADTPIANQVPVATVIHLLNKSFARVDTSEGSELTSGGNGIEGDDETSENLGTTWNTDADVSLPPAPIGHYQTAPIITLAEESTRTPYDGTSVTLSVSAEGYNDGVTGINFYYTVDGGSEVLVTGSLSKAGPWNAVVPGQSEGTVVTWYAVATHADGGTSTWPVNAPVNTEGWTVNPPPSGSAIPQKLLITEVSTGLSVFPFTSMKQLAMEFVEIHNPNSFSVDMSNYYLTDAINYTSQVYWLIANGPPHDADDIGGGNFNDFTARFPDGYTLSAGQTVVVSIAGSSWYEDFFHFLPDLELYEDDAEPDDIPDMRVVFGDADNPAAGTSIYTSGLASGSDDLPRGIPELEEFFGEPLVLYHWNEGDALVTDIDVFMWVNSGYLASNQERVGFSKTGVVIDGEAYKDDTGVFQQTWFMDLTQSGEKSYTRMDGDEGAQKTSGGNGVNGRDETSEDWHVTFETTGFSPGYFAGGVHISIPAELRVPAATFLPSLGETFPIEFEGPLDSEVKLRLFDLEGRLVRTLFDSRFDSFLAGITNQVIWDGMDDTFQPVRAGMYILHMSVVDMATGSEQFKTAPVVLATRLSK